MYDPLYDIGFTIFAVVFCAWWWFIAKDATTRKYIIFLGICWLLTGMAYIIAKSFDIPGLMVIVLLALLGSIYFLIKAALSAHKAKKKSPDD
jgi:uncharacterized membrane-anchored protein